MHDDTNFQWMRSCELCLWLKLILASFLAVGGVGDVYQEHEKSVLGA